MKSILPLDNVETINDVLTHYHFRLVPSLGSKHTYELMDTRKTVATIKKVGLAQYRYKPIDVDVDYLEQA